MYPMFVHDHVFSSQVYYSWRKVTEEFIKKIDPDLPFYYYTSGRSRYYQDLMSDFNTTPAKERKPVRLPRYELLGSNNRVTMAVCGDSSVRTKFHNVPVNLPLPPNFPNQYMHEHSYNTSTKK